MRRISLHLLCLPWIVSIASAEIDFNRDIRPILSENCFACHGPDKKHREANLRLDTFEGATTGGEMADPIVPGRPLESEMMMRILSNDPDQIMPPPKSHKELKPEEKALLRQWIEEGAHYEEPWTYVAPRRHPVPEVDEPFESGWIDKFILARLVEEKLTPSPDADPVTLVRRLHFDLLGLPPTPQEVDAFRRAAGKDPQAAVEQEVDRLLASPHFGERMAMYWLDLVRYADTCGYHGDQDHNISPYRDYVIDAFNDNMPFDRFTREQLAGDLLPNPTVDQRIATGYNRLLQTSHEGGVQPKEYLAIYFADRVRNLGSVWMGATTGCAQCHDHKYDPYTMKDFYALGAFFADIDEAQHFKVGSNSLPTKRPPEIQVHSKRERERLAELADTIDKMTDEAERRKLEAERAALEKNKRTTMVTVAIAPREIRVLPRGNWLDDSGEVVQPAFPEFLTADRQSQTANRAQRLTRLDLANWLTDPQNGSGGLTARVMVNRFWYLFFGKGISARLDDFGGQGQPPVHPELLDNLAVEFHESGWDVKHMVKLLVTSRAYRQSSLESPALRERDPYNRLLARQSRYRLPAETIRDNALAISGLLRTDYGGASAKPYQPVGYYRHLNFPQRKYAHHGDDRQWRRGVYVHWQRQFLHPMLRAFDAPTREECTAERPHSNTPIAAMTLLNDPTFVEAARVFAERILREAPSKDNGDRLEFAYRLALSRLPDETERGIMGRLFTSARNAYGEDSKAARALVSSGQAPVPDDLDPVEHATWTTVARAILNLSETYTRN